MQATYLGSETLAEGTILFRFSKPEGFVFHAGQSIDLTLINPPETDAEGDTRAYSLCSAPFEEELKVATRMRDTAFKRVLGSMPVGTEVKVLGPFGTFFVPDNTTRPVVCLAGGIGITPFRSMLLDAKKRGLSHMIYLFYSNRRPEDAAFLKEFTEQVSPQFVFVPTMTNAELSFIPWAGEIGYIDRVMLEKYLPKGSSPVYYLAGPEPMTHAMRTLLESMGVSNDDIRYEEFAGY